MKKLIVTLLLLSQVVFSQKGFRINPTEYFTVSNSIDPSSSIKENGLDVILELEYVSKVYVKIGVESFSVLQGGYKDVHWGMGINFTSGYKESFRYYSGIRTACVFRDGGYGINYGLEGGIDYSLNKNLFIGLRATLDKRNEQKIIFNWNPETKFSGFLRIGYKWDYKNR